MFFSGPWHLGLIKEAGGADFDGQVGDRPDAEEGEPATSFVGGSNVVVYKDSEEQGRRLGVRRVPVRPETQALWYTTVDRPAGRPGRVGRPGPRTTRTSTMFGEQLKDTKAQPAIPTWSEVVDGDQRRRSRR